MAVYFLIALLAVIVLTAGTAAWAAWRAAPYVPTWGSDVERLLSLAEVKAGDVVYDLGAGDGRIVLAAAKRGAQATGFEIAFLPYLVARIRILCSPYRRQAKMVAQDFFHADLSPADVIVCFLTPRAMGKLGEKFRRELRPGTRIVSYAFAIPGWTPDRKDKPQPKTMAVYRYTV